MGAKLKRMVYAKTYVKSSLIEVKSPSGFALFLSVSFHFFFPFLSQFQFDSEMLTFDVIL